MESRDVGNGSVHSSQHTDTQSFTTHQHANYSHTGRLCLETRLCDLALTHRRLQYMYRSCLVCLCVFRLPPVFLNRGEPGHAHTGRAHRSAQSQLKGHTDRRNVPDQADPQTHNLTSHNRPTEARRRPDHAEHGNTHDPPCALWCQSAAADNNKGRPPPPTQNDRPPPANPTLPPPAPRAPPRVCAKAVGEMKARAADA